MKWIIAFSILVVLIFILQFMASLSSTFSTDYRESSEEPLPPDDEEPFTLNQKSPEPQQGLTTTLTKVAVYNKDGTHRQKIIQELEEGDPLTLKRSPRSKESSASISVFTPGNKKIGYVDQDTARLIAPEMDKGKKFDVIIHSIKSTPNSSVKDVVVTIDHSSSLS